MDLVARVVANLNPVVVQVVRSVWQVAWSMLLGVEVVADALDRVGLAPEAAERAGLVVALVVVLLAGRYLGRVHPVFDVILSGIPKQPDYPNVVETTGRAKPDGQINP